MDNSDAGISVSGSTDDSLNLDQQSAITKQHSCSAFEVDTMCELGNVLHDTLQVKDKSLETDCDSPSDGGSSGLEDDDIAGDSNLNVDGSMTTSSKCLHKCATFPVTVGAEGKAPESQLENKVCTRSVSMPTTVKLVSAMKGSREKEGVPPRKLSVSWSPEVYDPPPSSLSHYPKKKSQQQFKSNKKHGKGKQKGKNMRGSAPKDKKHYRKMAGRSERCLDPYAETDRVHNYKPSLELLDFNGVGDDIGSPDPNCGSNFLGQASGTMHCVC